MLKMKRVYDGAQPSDGYRILVDRLWPRGVTKERAAVDLWAKDITPTTEIRKEFGHNPENFAQFRAQYLAELRANPAAPLFVQAVGQKLKEGDVTFVYAAKDPEINHVVVLRDYVEAALAKDDGES